MTLEGNNNLLNKKFKLGGMANASSKAEVTSVMEHINGVKSAEVDNNDVLSITFDKNKVEEGHLVSTLSSLGHSIIQEKK